MKAEQVNPAVVVEAVCRVCGASSPMRPYELYEVMYRTFEPFRYQLCPVCGSMQIETIPVDLSRHYPYDYYSLGGTRGSDLVRWIRAQGLRFASGGWNAVGQLLTLINRLPSDATWLKACKPRRDARILDVGCGRGDRLRELALAGFTRLQGIDPYVAADIEVAPGVTVVRGELESLTGEFDLIMLHHSLEHVPAPRTTVAAAARLLARSGMLLIRVPVMGSWAWRTYGTDWVQLDAPRHLYQFSANGILALAQSSGLAVNAVVYDSFDLQFSGSQRVRSARAGNADDPRFSKSELRRFRKRADTLNDAADGDQACFVLSHRSDV